MLLIERTLAIDQRLVRLGIRPLRLSRHRVGVAALRRPTIKLYAATPAAERAASQHRYKVSVNRRFSRGTGVNGATLGAGYRPRPYVFGLRPDGF